MKNKPKKKKKKKITTLIMMNIKEEIENPQAHIFRTYI